MPDRDRELKDSYSVTPTTFVILYWISPQFSALQQSAHYECVKNHSLQFLFLGQTHCFMSNPLNLSTT
jgi:hypothetical protein